MKDEVSENYDIIIKEQLELGIIEEAPAEPTEKRKEKNQLLVLELGWCLMVAVNRLLDK